MSGKLHITSAGQTELYLEETNPQNAANINFKTTIRTWALGAHNNPDMFYIGQAGGTFDFAMDSSGRVGI